MAGLRVWGACARAWHPRPAVPASTEQQGYSGILPRTGDNLPLAGAATLASPPLRPRPPPGGGAAGQPVRWRAWHAARCLKHLHQFSAPAGWLLSPPHGERERPPPGNCPGVLQHAPRPPSPEVFVATRVLPERSTNWGCSRAVCINQAGGGVAARHAARPLPVLGTAASGSGAPRVRPPGGPMVPAHNGQVQGCNAAYNKRIGPRLPASKFSAVQPAGTGQCAPPRCQAPIPGAAQPSSLIPGAPAEVRRPGFPSRRAAITTFSAPAIGQRCGAPRAWRGWRCGMRALLEPSRPPPGRPS